MLYLELRPGMDTRPQSVQCVRRRIRKDSNRAIHLLPNLRQFDSVEAGLMTFRFLSNHSAWCI